MLQLLASGGRLPVPTARCTTDHAQQRSDRQAWPELEPRVELLPRPAVHPDLASLPAFAPADEHGAARTVEISLRKRERFADPESGAPEQHDQRPEAQSVSFLTSHAHDCDDLLDRWRVGRVVHALVAGRAALVVAGHRRRGASMACGVESDEFHHSTSYC
jgi:hypothetical protein